eukprot:580605-Rhodomonas_salina.1
MAWCTLTHLQTELAIGVSKTVRLARVVEICTGTPKARLSWVLLQGQTLAKLSSSWWGGVPARLSAKMPAGG